MREKAEVDETTFNLTADVIEAHVQVLVHPADWHLLGCTLKQAFTFFINTVGASGVASASYYWWSRLAVALAQFLVGHELGTCLLPTTTTCNLEASLLVFFVLCLVGESHFPGTMELAAILLCAQASDFHTNRASCGSPKEEPKGFYVGLRRRPWCGYVRSGNRGVRTALLRAVLHVLDCTL